MSSEIAVKQRSNNKIEECRILGGIDTLYFFVDTKSSKLYQNIWDNVNSQKWQREGYSFLSFSGKKNGFIGGWFEHKFLIQNLPIPLFKVGFKNPQKQAHIKNLYIQLLGSGIYTLGFNALMEYVKIELSSLLDIPLTDDDIITSRVDLNAFVDGFDFGSIDANSFRTRSCVPRPKTVPVDYYDPEELDMQDSWEIHRRRCMETLYLGAKSSPLYFKIYDKNAEILANMRKQDTLSPFIKRSFLNQNRMTSDHVWNVEFTIKNEVLKQYNVLNLTHLRELANSIFKDLMQKTAFLGFDSQNIENYRQNKNISKLPLHPIWQKIIDSYSFFSGDCDALRTYVSYKTGSRKHSEFIIKKELLRQLDLEQPFSNRELQSFLDFVKNNDISSINNEYEEFIDSTL